MRPLRPPWTQTSDAEGPCVEPGTVIWTRPDSTTENLGVYESERSSSATEGALAHKSEPQKTGDAKARLTGHRVRYAFLQRCGAV
jgi:hypothetical protein